MGIDEGQAAGQRSTRTGLFFAVALGFTWALQLPALLAQQGILGGPIERFMPLAGLGGFGPLIAALFVTRRESGWAGVRAFFRPRAQAGARWYLTAFLLFPAISVAGAAVHALVPGSGAVRLLYLPENAQHVATTIIVPLAEEPGWRGFALPRLQARYGAFNASLLLGVGWALYHVVMFVLAGTGATPGLFALMMVNILVGSVVFSWLYNRTGGSLLAAILAHAGAHANNPTHALPADATPFVVYTVAVAVAAVAVVTLDRKAWPAAQASAAAPAPA